MAAAKASSMIMALIMVAGLLQSASAVTHTLTWTFATNATQYDEWATRQNFVVGDDIQFNYNNASHNVFEVTQADLNSCNLNNPLQQYLTSNAKVTLNRSGYFGFICGFSGHCSSGFMHMNVDVAAASTPTVAPVVSPVSSPPSTTPTTSPPPASTPSAPRPVLNTPASAPGSSDASSLQTRSYLVVGALVAGCAAVLL